MGVAIAAITIGAWFTYSALTGTSLADVFKGDTKKPNPSGTVDVTAALKDAGIDPSQPLTTGGVPLGGGGTGQDSMEAEMNRMIGLHLPYKWGGGHAAFDADGPWDCSGAVSWLTHFMGMLSGKPLTSTGFMTWGDSGRGKVFTVYANPTHVFIKMESGRYAGQCWGTTTRIPSQGGSLAWHDHTTVGFVARHHEGW